MQRRRPIAGVVALAVLVVAATAGCDPTPVPPVFRAVASASGPDADLGDGICATVGGGCSFEAAIAEANAEGEARIDVAPGVHAAGAATITGDVDLLGEVRLAPDAAPAMAPEVDLTVAPGATLRVEDLVLHTLVVEGSVLAERVALTSSGPEPEARAALDVASTGVAVMATSIVDARTRPAVRNRGHLSLRFASVWAGQDASGAAEATVTTIDAGETTMGATAVLAEPGTAPRPTCAGTAPLSEGWNALPDASCALTGSGDVADLAESDPVPGPDSVRTDAVPVGALGCRTEPAEDLGTVVALDGDGDQQAACDTGAFEGPRHPNQAPVAAVEVTANSGFAPASVELSAAGSTDDGGIVSHLWSFGDGTPATAGDAVTSHVYEDGGTFTATVTVTDGQGATASASVEVTVEDRRGSLPLGSPRNHIGTGSLLGVAEGEMLNLAVNPSCTSKVNGDRYQSLHYGPLDSSFQKLTSCPATPTNADHRPGGYELYVEAREGRTAPIDVLLLDPSYNATTVGAEGPLDTKRQAGDEPFTFSLAAADATPADDADNPLLEECTRTFTATTPFELSYLGSARWNRLCTITPDMPSGRYVLRVRNTGVAVANRDGSNQWGLVARDLGAPGDGLCDGRTEAMCPRVYGKDDLSLYARTPATVSSFFLAEIDESYAGRTVEIELWDPGEGMGLIEVLRPTGPDSWAPAAFGWTAFAEGATTSYGGESNVTSLDVTNSRFNGRLVRIRIPLAAYAPPEGNRWWKVQYTSRAGGVTDRTTWTARIAG